ncbi:hypothetical protein Lsed01_00841 [Demequina sediminis]|uniref:Uncharacterized protein n=2 Tax=Demequina sediminis TaxID=1930058 RepID=A0ABP9WFQ5_9MICO
MKMHTQTTEAWLSSLPHRYRHPDALDAFEKQALERAVDGSWLLVRTDDGNSALHRAIALTGELNTRMQSERWTVDLVKPSNLVQNDFVTAPPSANILVVHVNTFFDYYGGLSEAHREALTDLLTSYDGDPSRRIIFVTSSPVESLEENLGADLYALLAKNLSDGAVIDREGLRIPDPTDRLCGCEYWRHA